MAVPRWKKYLIGWIFFIQASKSTLKAFLSFFYFFFILGSTPPEVNIDEDSSIGSNVVTFKAFGDLNEAVKYAVAGGNIGKVFDVDSLTGIVYVNQTLDYETHDR